VRQLVRPRTTIRDIGCSPQGIYRGKLAEDYDGIGQYVSVSLAGSSVGSAYKARIASGDFGGGRKFPRGTPVTVLSHRGQLEVLLGNLPKGCRCGDPFSRVESTGLGSGPLGTYIMPNGAQDFFVDGSAAWFRLAKTGIPYALLRPSTGPTLPLEILFKLHMHSNISPFNGWSGFGNATYNDFEFFARLCSGSSASNFDTISFECFGTFPDAKVAFGQSLQRPGGVNEDFNDVELIFDNTINLLDFYFRFYVDIYGVYGRIWRQSEIEPTTVEEGMVIPYDLLGEPSKSNWIANGGGKGEAWHSYGFSEQPLPEAELKWFDFGSAGVAGSTDNDTWAVIDDVCVISGGWC
jgi:hypothetical protein